MAMPIQNQRGSTPAKAKKITARKHKNENTFTGNSSLNFLYSNYYAAKLCQ